MHFLRRHSLPIGILLMYAFTWPPYLAAAGVIHVRFPLFIRMLPGWGFIYASVLMTALVAGAEGVGRLLRRFLIWRVGWRWYAALLVIPAVDLVGIFLHAAFTRTTPAFGSARLVSLFGVSPKLVLFALLTFVITAVANGEEIGWRGYALPRLQDHRHALYSAIVIGLVWALWHIPLWIRSWNPTAYAWYTLGVLAKSVFITWIYNSTGGSLLLATLCHAVWNTMGSLLPLTATVSPGDIGALAVIILVEVAVAGVIAAIAGPVDLSRGRERQRQTQAHAN
jgi:membrane protease YdiL (CAAX protease family)